MTSSAQYGWVLLIGILGAVGMYLLKVGVMESAGGLRSMEAFLSRVPQLVVNKHIIAALVLYALAYLVFLFLLSGHDLSHVLPMVTAVYFCLTAIMSAWLLGETISLIRIVGMATIIFGMVLVDRGS